MVSLEQIMLRPCIDSDSPTVSMCHSFLALALSPKRYWSGRLDLVNRVFSGFALQLVLPSKPPLLSLLCV